MLSDVLTSENVKTADISLNYKTDDASYLTGTANCGVLSVLRLVGLRISSILPAVTFLGVILLATLVGTSTKHPCFFLTIPLALWVSTGSAYHVSCRSVKHSLKKWQKRTAQKEVQKAFFYVFVSNLNTLVNGWAQTATHLCNQCHLLYRCRKNELENYSPWTGILVDALKKCKLEHSDTERLYPVETLPNHPSPNR